MPSAAIYIFDQTGEAKRFATLPDSMLHAPVIWRALARKHMPDAEPRRLVGRPGEWFGVGENTFVTQAIVAELVERAPDWPPFERRVFATTLFGVIMRPADLLIYADSIREFIRHHQLGGNEQLRDEMDIIWRLGVGNETITDPTLAGVGWMISDAVENPWADVDGRPYNLNTDDEHRWLDRDGNVETREVEACDAPSC